MNQATAPQATPSGAAQDGVAQDGSGDEPVVRYAVRGRTALITLNRPRFRNAQNSAMTYALDEAFTAAVNDDDVAVVVLAGAGDHFSAGHDIGTPRPRRQRVLRPDGRALVGPRRPGGR